MKSHIEMLISDNKKPIREGMGFLSVLPTQPESVNLIDILNCTRTGFPRCFPGSRFGILYNPIRPI